VLNRARVKAGPQLKNKTKTSLLAIALMLCPGLTYLRGGGEYKEQPLKHWEIKVVERGRTTSFSG